MKDADRPPQLSNHNAAAFQLEDVVGNYHLRSPYPSSLFAFLLDLAEPRNGVVLELGCGTGEIARSLAPDTARLDAIDISAPMLERARAMPGGDHAAIRWILGASERAPMDGPYSLAVAGDSLHWMDWDLVLPRLRKHLAPGAVLAVVHAVIPQLPWSEAISALIAEYSVIRDFKRVDLIEELEARGLFKPLGKVTLGPERFQRTLGEYIDAMHATAGLPRSRMGAEQAEVFDNKVRALLAQNAQAGTLELNALAEVTWGIPLSEKA